jgi:hypothetical protein
MHNMTVIQKVKYIIISYAIPETCQRLRIEGCRMVGTVRLRIKSHRVFFPLKHDNKHFSNKRNYKELIHKG